ncbi:hypothetical protein KXW53_003884, partial [Aspergillus fumigatus]
AAKVKKIAERRKGYGSLYHNQEEFSGILPCMPASSELLCMSAEDERLMWDILDFGTSCSFATVSKLDASSFSRDHQMGGVSVPWPLDDPSPTGHNPVGEVMADLPRPQTQDPRPATDSLEHCLPSEWPISNTDELGLSMPDAAEWLLFGGHLPEQL